MANMKEANKHLIALTEEKEQIFYNILQEGKTFQEACKVVGISKNTYLNHGKRKPAFIIKCKNIINKKKLEKVKKKPAKIIIKEQETKVGRPTLMTPDVIAKLKEGFSQGFSIANACIWADISADVYFDYCKIHPEFSDYCKALKQKPLIKSILVINKALNEGDVSTAKWYAERKAKDEFSLRNEITGEDGEPVQVKIPEIKVIFTDEK